MIFFTSFHGAWLWNDILCCGGSDSPDKPFLFYYQFPVVILYCFSFISGFIKFNSLWNMPTAFIFWVINAFILFLKLGHIKMDMSVGDCPLWVQTCFTLGWHLAKLWPDCGSDLANRSELPKCQHSTHYVGQMNASGVGQINIYLDCNNLLPVIPITFPAHLFTSFTLSWSALL